MQKLLEDMTLEEKIGQLMMVTFDQESINGDIITLIKHYYIGGVLLQFDEHVKPRRLARMNKYLQYYASNRRPLFIANELQTDEFTLNTSEVAIPSEDFFHKLNNRLYTKQLSEVIGQELQDVGMNAVLYPNLHIENIGDLRNKVDSHVYHGEAAIQGLRQSNVVSFVTGFPSSGEIDSFIEPDRRKSNLYPFYEVIKKGVDLLAVPETSASYIHEQIQRNLQYENMIAHRILEEEFSTTTAENIARKIIDIINNGVNLIILPFTYEQQIDILNRVIELAKLGEINEDFLHASIEGLFSLKEKYNLNGMKPTRRPLTTHQIKNVKEKIIRSYAQKVDQAE